MKKVLLLSTLMFGFHFVFGQTNYYSKSSATDFNDLSTWGNVADGTGTSPTSLSQLDTFIIANNAMLSLTANASVGRMNITLGKLTIAANTLTLGFAGKNNSINNFSAGGFLEVSGGLLDVRGAMHFQNGAGLTQTGGLIIIDGNNGGDVATSVPAGVQFLGLGTAGTNTAGSELNAAGVANFSLTGGTIQIVDGTAATNNYQLVGYRSTGTSAAPINLLCGTGHTFIFGDGVSTDPVGNAEGLSINANLAGGVFSFGNVEVNIAGGQNRFFKHLANFSIRGNLTVSKGALICANGLYLEGNLINNDTIATITNGTFSFQRYTAITSPAASAVTPVLNPQTITGNGKFINSYTVPTANFTNLTINNRQTPVAAIVIPPNMISGVGTGSISGILTLTNGYIDLQTTPLIMGIGTVAATTVNITAANNAAIIGEVQHWFPSGTTTTQKNYQVGILGRNNNFVMRFPGAITTGGRVSVKFSTTAPSSAGLPILAEAGNAGIAIETVSPSGYWIVEPLAGLTLGATGTYTVNANATGFTTNIATPLTVTTGLALIKRPTGGNWAAGASGVAGVAALNNFFRQNMTDFSEFAIGGTLLALPIKLSSFEGKATGQVNTLSWISENEINSDKFVVERSSNGTNFKSVGVVNTKATNGNSSIPLSYTFVDAYPINGKQFYRLSMVDKDGSSEYSETVTIKQNIKKMELANVGPNPTKGIVSFNVRGTENYNVVVHNSAGQIVITKTVKQSNISSIDFGGLANGIYTVEIMDVNTNEKIKHQVVKQ
jgi:Secretion system C-terminal sorting domain